MSWFDNLHIDDRVELVSQLLAWTFIGALLWLASGCGSPGPQMPSKACMGQYAEMVASHSAELFQACLPAKDVDACVEAQPEIDAKYDAAFTDWEAQCLR